MNKAKDFIHHPEHTADRRRRQQQEQHTENSIGILICKIHNDVRSLAEGANLSLPLCIKRMLLCSGGHMQNFLEKHNILNQCQYGFSRRKATNDVLTKVITRLQQLDGH